MDIIAVLKILVPLVRKHEGLRLRAYLDSAGKPTIGYGHTKDVSLGQTISKAQAEVFLLQDIADALVDVITILPALASATPQRVAAITDFTFNLGAGRLRASTLRRKIEAGDYDAVPDQLRRWVYAVDADDLDEDGDTSEKLPLPGLIKRREDECSLWRGAHGFRSSETNSL